MQSRAGWIRVAALAGVAALALAGCASSIRPAAPAPGVPSISCGTLTLAVNPWVGYEANVAVVSYLAKERLGCTVVEKDLTEEESWQGLARGEIDAILENWGHDDLKKRYIDREKSVVEQGITGNKGVIGWYVPPWMVEEYPDITDWRNLNKYADLFRTSKSGSKGQFLDGDPSYVTNDEALVRNLKLNYKVVYAGSEAALIEAFRVAEAKKKPLIGYFYAPQWFLSEVELAHIDLPTYVPGCDADPKTVACDYQPYDLDKIANKRFAESGSPAATLIRNFQWTDADQNAVARYLTVDKLSRDQAAKKWLDANPKVWQGWLPPS
ncbi:ABC transporter substrate-binding protein [Micromonospora sp. NPDC049679]|uniref:ABC transporter substrate-binding protein n=1 Tax=Micromonospora sp. NPDC049679 TaxID=3155920 RepID=UPI0034033C82